MEGPPLNSSVCEVKLYHVKSLRFEGLSVVAARVPVSFHKPMPSTITIIVFFCFLRFYLFIFRERGREGERDREKRQCVVAPHMPPTGDLAYNPGMSPDWESNRVHC